MNVCEIIKMLQILRENVCLNELDSKYTIINDVKPSSFDWIIHDTIKLLENYNK